MSVIKKFRIKNFKKKTELLRLEKRQDCLVYFHRFFYTSETFYEDYGDSFDTKVKSMQLKLDKILSLSDKQDKDIKIYIKDEI